MWWLRYRNPDDATCKYIGHVYGVGAPCIISTPFRLLHVTSSSLAQQALFLHSAIHIYCFKGLSSQHSRFTTARLIYIRRIQVNTRGYLYIYICKSVCGFHLFNTYKLYKFHPGNTQKGADDGHSSRTHVRQALLGDPAHFSHLYVLSLLL